MMVTWTQNQLLLGRLFLVAEWSQSVVTEGSSAQSRYSVNVKYDHRGIKVEEFGFNFSFLVASIIIVTGNFPILMSCR
jgi:hypothetical protein